MAAHLRLGLALWAGAALFLSGSAVPAGVIQWSGPATVSYGVGNSFTDVPVANPIITVNSPGNFSGMVPGVSNIFWNVSLQNAANGELIKLTAFANSVQAQAIAGQPGVLVQQRKVVRIVAEYSITTDPLVPVTIGLQTNASVNVSGSVVNNIGFVDEAWALASLDLSETSSVPGGELFTNEMIREFHKIDGMSPSGVSKDLIPLQIANKSNGVYKLQVDIDLAALAIGNPGEERATASWSSAVALSLGTFDAIGATVPEPATWLLALGAAAGLGITSRRSRSRRAK